MMNTNSITQAVSRRRFFDLYEKLVFVLLFTTTFCLPWGELIQLPITLNSPKTLIGHVLLIAWIIKIIIFRKIKHPSKGFVFAMLFLVWGIASLLWSVNVGGSLVALRELIAALVYAYIIWDMVSTEPRMRAILLAYVLGAGINVLGVIHNYIFDIQYFTRNWRYSAFGYNPNDIAFSIVLAVPMAWNLYLKFQKARGLTEVLFLFPFFAMCAIFYTGSRSAYVALVVAFAFLGYIFVKKFLIKEKVISFCLFIITILIMIIYPPKYLTHGNVIASLWTNSSPALLNNKPITSVPSHSNNASNNSFLNRSNETLKGALLQNKHEKLGERTLTFDGRVPIWKVGFTLFSKRPFTGFGVGAFKEAVYPIFHSPLAAHNFLIQILVEVGLIGLFCFAIMALIVMLCLRQKEFYARWLYVMLCILWLIGVSTQNYLYSFITYFVFSCVLTASALPIGVDKKSVVTRSIIKV